MSLENRALLYCSHIVEHSSSTVLISTKLRRRRSYSWSKPRECEIMTAVAKNLTRLHRIFSQFERANAWIPTDRKPNVYQNEKRIPSKDESYLGVVSCHKRYLNGFGLIRIKNINRIYNLYQNSAQL